jgi:DNA-binding IclR family transcriptional regulator
VLAFHLGRTYAEAVDLPSYGNQVAREISAKCDETVHVAVLDRTDVVYVAKADSTKAVRMVSGVGRLVPANCTAVGKMLLSALTPEALSALYPTDQPLPALTPQSITSLSHLRAELEQIRERGYSIEECESNDGVACVAAPVYDADSMVAAISISVPMTRWPGKDQLTEFSALVCAGAQQLSTRLGGPLTANRLGRTSPLATGVTR